MKVSVVWSEDRWGEEPQIVAVFTDHDQAMAFGRAETSRSHALAEETRRVSAARLYFVSVLTLDDPVSGSEEFGIAGLKLSERVTRLGMP